TTLSETAGRTATVTGALVAPFALAWYEVRIVGLAAYVHVPPAPVRTVAIERNDGSPNACARTSTDTPLCPPDTEPDSVTARPWVVRGAGRRTVTAGRGVRNGPSAPRVVPALFEATRRKW